MNPLVLSIQSHVVHGRAGNRGAILAIELNGIDANPLNTVQFSTNAAYAHRRGTVMNDDEFTEIIKGLQMNEITPLYTDVLTGYIANPKIIDSISDFISSLGPNVHYLCDPVLGDAGKLYLSEECFEKMVTSLIPKAATITPNAYEAMWIANSSMNNQQELLEIVATLHSKGPKNVIITSTEWKRRFSFFSFENGAHQFVVETPSLSRSFDGPGDLFAGLLLANMINLGTDYAAIAERTVNSTFAVLEKTMELNSREVVLTRCIKDLMDPVIKYRVMSLEDFMQADVNK